MKDDVIIKTITRIMLPFIQIFALYVIAHGELGPGGGFQGGVIIGSSIILLALVWGSAEARDRFSQRLNDILNSVGVLIYVGIGVVCVIFGGFFLEYGKLPFHSPEKGNHLGMFGIEIGVGITVAAVMVTIFFEMSTKYDD